MGEEDRFSAQGSQENRFSLNGTIRDTDKHALREYISNENQTYPIDRAWTDMFADALRDMGFSGYGVSKKDVEPWLRKEIDKMERFSVGENAEQHIYYENELFTIRPYYWGNDLHLSSLPNFVYKPSGLEIKWYKYALRDSSSNQKVSQEELDSIMNKCVEFIEKLNPAQKYENSIRGFSQKSRAWYGKNLLSTLNIHDEVIFGLYLDDNSTFGELSVRWIFENNNFIPKIIFYSDSWGVLSTFHDVIDILGEHNNENPSPDEFCQYLLNCGFVDRTKEINPFEDDNQLEYETYLRLKEKFETK